MRKLLLVLVAILAIRSYAATITETYPQLGEATFKEPKSNFYLGFGLSPIGVLHGRMMTGIDFFQIHWIKDPWDVELLNASYAATNANPSYVQSRHFTFRMAPKYRFFKFVSIGPLLGYEYVTFPEINAQIVKAPWATHAEPFSSKGMIYGLMASETFHVWTDYLLKVNEVVFKQSYSTQKTDDEWDYLYDRRSLRTDRSSIEADLVFLLQFSILF